MKGQIPEIHSPLASGRCNVRLNCSRKLSLTPLLSVSSVREETYTVSDSNSTSASGSGTRMPSAGKFMADTEEDELSLPRTLGGDPDIGVAETDGALLYTRRFVRDGAECKTGGTRREGEATAEVGVMTPCDGVRDLDRECAGVCI